MVFSKKYGSIFSIYLMGRTTMVITNPRVFPTIFKDSKLFDFRNFIEGLVQVVLNIPKAAATSKALKDANHAQYVKHLTGSSVYPLTEAFIYSLLNKINDEISHLPTRGTTIELVGFSQKVVFNASCKALFGSTCPSDIRSDVFLFDEGMHLIFANFPSFITSKYIKARERCISAFMKMLETGMQNPNALAASQDQVLIDEGFDLQTRGSSLFGLMWGLQTNSTQAAFWCLAYLLTKTTSDFRQKLFEEGKEAFKVSLTSTNTLTATPNIPLLTSAPYLSALFNETLRTTSGTLMWREVSRDTVVEDPESGRKFLARKGGLVSLPARHVHLDEGIYERADEFRPERWIESKDGTRDGKMGRIGLLPFGGGVSLCPGRFFASHEIKSFVALMLQLFDMEVLDPLPGLGLNQYGVGVMAPTGKMRVQITLKNEWKGALKA
ncbi:hypothetical protein HK097_010996 [Rhizophlyctis rosea]|uniref:Cytochrome P450 n=1 Tax=Rhizophlyctis rosea TaxID=64517 RepID=A0AAD5WZG0_9FUNG|nr:hypothetical protein HK097_010996 [Rhizophlyctis rosea]